jgi:hypothetical protein
VRSGPGDIEHDLVADQLAAGRAFAGQPARWGVGVGRRDRLAQRAGAIVGDRIRGAVDDDGGGAGGGRGVAATSAGSGVDCRNEVRNLNRTPASGARRRRPGAEAVEVTRPNPASSAASTRAMLRARFRPPAT